MSDRVAVVGSGISGLTAAYVISRTREVTLFERDGRLGGHADTAAVRTADGRELGLDTGFIVHNERTYPTMLRLFRELGVRTQESDMSFGVSCEGCGLEYAGARGLAGVLPTPRALGRGRYLRMLAEIRRFHRHARRVLVDPSADPLTIQQFIEQGDYSAYFCDHFLLPLTGAIWSSSPAGMREFPARYLIRFFANHGMLTVKHSPTWRTVCGGSRIYVQRIGACLGPGVRTGEPVETVRRQPDAVYVNGERFDQVVIATHADQALRMLDDPSDDERRLLACFPYSTNSRPPHRRLAAAPGGRGPRLLELPARRLLVEHPRRPRDLPPEPVAGAAGTSRVLRDAEPDGAHRPGGDAAHDGLRAPRVHARRPARPAPAARR